MIGLSMLVAPGEAEMAVDSLSHAFSYCPGAHACLRYDGKPDRTYDTLSEFAGLYSGRVCLMQNESTLGYAGHSISTFRNFDHIWRAHPDVEMVIKLDPDACILRPGLVDCARRKFAEHGPGMLGCYKISPSGAIREHHIHRKALLRDLLLVGRDQGNGKLRFGPPFYLQYLVRALRHGYSVGHAVLGGLYILHGETVIAAGRTGYWSAIGDWGSCHMKLEDVLVSLGTKSAGHSLIDINNPAAGDVPAWVQYRPPIQPSFQEIVERNYLAIHPVKNTPEGWELRTELRRMLSH